MGGEMAWCYECGARVPIKLDGTEQKCSKCGARFTNIIG